MFKNPTTPRILGSVLVALLLTVSTHAAQAGTWGVRVRATYLDMADKSDAFTALGTNFAANSVDINNKLIPEFDISYWITPNVSAEVVLTIPQSQDVTLKGVGRLGTFKHLPPCFMGQYHFLPESKFQPYLGVGFNFTLIYDKKLSVAGVPLDLESSSLGLALQAGFDYDLGNNRYFNFDVKNVGLRSDVLAGGARLTTARLDPWLWSLGFGWRF